MVYAASAPWCCYRHIQPLQLEKELTKNPKRWNHSPDMGPEQELPRPYWVLGTEHGMALSLTKASSIPSLGWSRCFHCTELQGNHPEPPLSLPRPWGMMGSVAQPVQNTSQEREAIRGLCAPNPILGQGEGRISPGLSIPTPTACTEQSSFCIKRRETAPLGKKNPKQHKTTVI